METGMFHAVRLRLLHSPRLCLLHAVRVRMLSGCLLPAERSTRVAAHSDAGLSTASDYLYGVHCVIVRRQQIIITLGAGPRAAHDGRLNP